MNNYYKAKIIEIIPGSVAEKYCIEPGDSLLAVDGLPLKDLLDYQFAIADTKNLELLIKKKDGQQVTIKITKNPNDELGLIFESGVFDKVKLCNNKCIFCFVDQQPPGLRETLYVKDDDYRLSFLHGTYITLTNLTKKDKERIERLRLGPLFVSVHSTNPEVRIKMLGNKLAGTIMHELLWLNSLDIPVHTQIVVCPGYNDSKELERTLKDLSDLENVLSIAVVPLGLTRYREDLNLKPFTKEHTLETLKIIKNISKSLDKNIIFPSDEIYFLAEEPLPESNFYEEFPQLEDGVGSSRLILSDFEKLKLPEKISNPVSIGIICGTLARPVLAPMVEALNKIQNLKAELIEVKSNFWGDHVTVSGLIVGKDIIDTLEKLDSLPEILFIPSVMLRKFSEEFLDGIKLKEIEDLFKVKIVVVNNFYSFKEVINKLS